MRQRSFIAHAGKAVPSRRFVLSGCADVRFCEVSEKKEAPEERISESNSSKYGSAFLFKEREVGDASEDRPEAGG